MKNVNWRTKAVYLLIAAVLAIGLVPMTAGVTSVGAADGNYLNPAVAYNVLGSPETFSVEGTVDHWNVTWQPQIHPWVVSGGGTSNNITLNCVALDPGYEGGAAYIDATMSNGDIYSGVKYWGKIDATVLTPEVWSWSSFTWVPATTRSSAVRFDENRKDWEGEIMVNETVLGSYNTNKSPEVPTGILEIPASGAEVHWFVVDSSADVSVLASLTNLGAIEVAIDAMPDAELIDLKYGDGWRASRVTYSDGGYTTQRVRAEGPQACYIIAVACYPEGSGIFEPVHAEIESWNFYAADVSVVPQVRWVGEKIVLEKYFGESYNGCLVHFETDAPGKLEDTDLAYQDSDFMDTPTSVWTPIEQGIARCILQCGDAVDVQVLCTVYDWYSSNRAELGNIVNEHLFVVYFLKLEDITLGNVEGERVDNPLTLAAEGHNSGIFAISVAQNGTITSNPWSDPWGTDEASYLKSVSDGGTGGVVGPVDPTTGELNISQDTLLRARVRGYFEGNQASLRLARAIDSNHDGKIGLGDISLPAGRWVLPDDWQYLASTDWSGYNAYWDIMDQPNDAVMSDADGNPDPEQSLDDLGAYVEWGHSNKLEPTLDTIDDWVARWPVVGPYSSLDTYWPGNFGIPHEKTIVPNGQLNWWDCPMPPALVTFWAQNGMGYFKEVEKGDVYYKLVNAVIGNPVPDSIAYTNPYYALCIPANPWLQDMACANNGRYLWNTWDDDYGWYNLWNFVNQNDAVYPTNVKVYSDNHGEAMVWLNGDNPYSYSLSGQGYWWDGQAWSTSDFTYQKNVYGTIQTYNVPPSGFQNWTTIVSNGGDVKVGNTTARAGVDYPYFSADPALYSNKVTKDWTWGESKIVDVLQLSAVQGGILNGHKLVLVWLTDRDGMADTGLTIRWELIGTTAKLLNSAEFPVNLSNGNLTAESVSRLPTRTPVIGEVATYWNTTKLGPCGSAIAGVEVLGAQPNPQISILITIYNAEGELIHTELINFNAQDMMDPLLTKGLNSGVYEGKAQSIVDATQTIQGNLVAIWWKDNSGVWHAYQPGAPAWANDLSMLEPGNTYWVNVSNNCNWNWALN